MKREIIKLAIIPTRLSSGQWIWFTIYRKVQELQKVWCCISDMGWPDIGKWGYKDEWVTIRKELF